MKALVVYESLWGNTAAIARAVAEGLGEGAVALSTKDAVAGTLAEIDLLVAGAPLLGFALPTDSMRASIESNPAHKNHPPDLTAPSMRGWLEGLGPQRGYCATFETRIWWSPGSSAKSIAKALAALGCKPVIQSERFLVQGTYGPLKDGELERARAWGEQLGRAVQERTVAR